MRWYSHNNIIIFVNNVIILEFKFARVRSATNEFIFFQYELEHKTNES